LGLHLIVDRGLGSLRDQDLAGGRCVAEPRREDDDVADGAVVISPFEADPSQRGVPGRNPDSEAQVVSALLPRARQLDEALPDRDRRAHRRQLVVRHRRRVVEEGHQPVPGEVLDRPCVRCNELADGAVVLPEHAEHLLGLRGLRERGEPA
jgi:hypothetical protein